MNENPLLAPKLDIDLAEANIDDDSNAKSWMFDAITDRELVVHRVGAEWTIAVRIQGRLLA